MKIYVKTLFILLISPAMFAQQSELKQFVPNGFKILDSEQCDLNQDGFKDYIVILKNENETIETELNRPLLIIEGKKGGVLKLVAKNEQIVLCFDCGGIFGDPYAGITVKKNYFSIEHFGGSNWRWTRVITFKYDKKLKKYILHKDAGESFSVFDLKKVEYQSNNKESWDKIEFENYKVE
jgi:hypothetical protein